MSEEFKHVWKKARFPGENWAYYDPVREGDLPTWIKSCELFSVAVLRKPDDKVFEVRFYKGEAGCEETFFEKKIDASNVPDALKYAEECVARFFEAGAREWQEEIKQGGLRFMQVASHSNNLVGLTHDGRVYIRRPDDSGWTPMNMKATDVK